MNKWLKNVCVRENLREKKKEGGRGEREHVPAHKTIMMTLECYASTEDFNVL